jgi:hypothetical protein
MSVQSLPSIIINRGTDFERSVSIGTTILNSGIHSTVSKIRKHSSADEYAEFQTYINDTTNKVIISMGNTITTDLDLGRNYFDIFLINNQTNKTIKLVEGSIIVNDSASR